MRLTEIPTNFIKIGMNNHEFDNECNLCTFSWQCHIASHYHIAKVQNNSRQSTIKYYMQCFWRTSASSFVSERYEHAQNSYSLKDAARWVSTCKSLNDALHLTFTWNLLSEFEEDNVRTRKKSILMPWPYVVLRCLASALYLHFDFKRCFIAIKIIAILKWLFTTRKWNSVCITQNSLKQHS